MNKQIILASALLLLLTAVGCNAQEDTTSKIYVNPSTMPETQTIAVETTSADTTAVQTTTAQTTTTVTTTQAETTFPAASTAPEEAAQTTENAQDAASTEIDIKESIRKNFTGDPELLGRWRFFDGYEYRFRENADADTMVDYSDMLYFQNDNMYFLNQFYPIQKDGNSICISNAESTLVHLTPVNGTLSSDYSGIYTLDDCYLYEYLSSNDPGAKFTVEVGNGTWVCHAVQYTIINDSLRMHKNGDWLSMQYSIIGDELHMTDDEGDEVVLTRVDE